MNEAFDCFCHSNYRYKDNVSKSRIIQNARNWYTIEEKPTQNEGLWHPYIAGTKEWLSLSKEDIEWAKPSKEFSKETQK